MDDKLREKQIRMFFRKLKEIGKYTYILDYLTESHKRSFKELEFGIRQDEKFMDNNGLNIADSLHLASSLGHAYVSMGHAYWSRNIMPISRIIEAHREEFYRGHFDCDFS